MSTFSISLKGNAFARLQQLARAGVDLSTPMAAVAQVLSGESEDAFANEQDPETGQAWQALSDNYVKQNPARALGQILQMSQGGLASSITTDSGSTWAQIGSNKEYAAIHQLGGTSDMAPGPAAIPARPYLGLGEQGEDEILDLLANHLLG
ncbi:phage virion morphogenesis protein [Pseudoalteromonas sp. CO325X]|uniref:phage virion morphogenesis protein n=1 Tax=Pseudoalteromonas sp. CO325X TaxID=1777262 RepID=UPI001022C9E4|nr:phage virion morphogenesis protein [Pseudoalteromonas sp. CO325X]RZF83716.1 phage virion morphogenesis protein [Pseudoalteromonas sp. CO325X]